MADIKQAAKWLSEGKTVRRPEWPYEGKYDAVYCKPNSHELQGRVGSLCWLHNLLADDWELAGRKGEGE